MKTKTKRECRSKIPGNNEIPCRRKAGHRGQHQGQKWYVEEGVYWAYIWNRRT